MTIFSKTRKNSASTLTAFALTAATIMAICVSTRSAEAEGLILRKGFAAGENGVAARSRGAVSNGEGLGGFRRSGFASNGEGTGFAGRGGCVSGATAAGCRAGGATWNAEDGTFNRKRGVEASGESRALSSRQSLSRDSEGNLTGSRNTDASGTRGSYAGSATLDDGTYNRDGTYTGSDGQSANIESSYEQGTGGSRTVTCVDASGTIVSCP